MEGDLRGHYLALQRVARDLDIEWETEFSFTAATLDEVARRTPILARAVDCALSLIQARPRRTLSPFQRQFREQLSAIGQQLRFKVVPRARIPAGQEAEITVDYQLTGVRNEAAVEVLTANTTAGAQTSVDRTAANFHELDQAHYPGLLVAVYDENSAAGQERLRKRLEVAAPMKMVVIPGREAVPELVRRLAA